jgi:hypothetical protein
MSLVLSLVQLGVGMIVMPFVVGCLLIRVVGQRGLDG